MAGMYMVTTGEETPAERELRLFQVRELNPRPRARLTARERRAVLKRLRSPRPADPAWVTRDRVFRREDRQRTLARAARLLEESADVAAGPPAGSARAARGGVIHYNHRAGRSVPCTGPGSCPECRRSGR